MTTEAAKDWAEEVETRSKDFEAYLETHWTDDSFGWGEMLQNLLIEDGTGRTKPTGLLLTGPEGCGRHTAAAHMVRILQEQEFDSVWLTGEDLLEAGTVSDARERLDALLDDFEEQEKGLCLVIEQLEGWDGRKELLTYLGKALWKCWLEREEGEDSRLFLILIDSGRGIPSLLREQLQRCRMTLPDLDHRRCFLDNNPELTGYVDMEHCAACTEGFTYAQLTDLVRDLRMVMYLTDEPISKEKVEQMAAEQREEPPAAQSARRRAALEERFAQLMEELPALLKSIPVVSGAQVTQPAIDQEQTQSRERIRVPLSSVTRESLEKQPIDELMADLYGEERAKRIIQQARQKQRARANEASNVAAEEADAALLAETEAS